ncbi:hypothetical protein GALMADRAFT_214273 [Galerina marginata CBS 339.88]|uniref:Uncharacterized protein n=1 Tax=Galerina marginata (strain CBS 339.88) TaxID=685588 RepID=A0A067SVY9_GALM3|nr:hypothetical protein GALMADRAFT_214273 [Galerina marginata CBS 339.88]
MRQGQRGGVQPVGWEQDTSVGVEGKEGVMGVLRGQGVDQLQMFDTRPSWSLPPPSTLYRHAHIADMDSHEDEVLVTDRMLTSGLDQGPPILRLQLHWNPSLSRTYVVPVACHGRSLAQPSYVPIPDADTLLLPFYYHNNYDLPVLGQLESWKCMDDDSEVDKEDVCRERGDYRKPSSSSQELASSSELRVSVYTGSGFTSSPAHSSFSRPANVMTCSQLTHSGPGLGSCKPCACGVTLPTMASSRSQLQMGRIHVKENVVAIISSWISDLGCTTLDARRTTEDRNA